ncbi:hypothetical protein EJ08DRAFT_657257 [Tothia fuscella]|uniref:Uncharacterized protein n=1 Tax=Tothia fuscella TaxID=1048955 RepID=A0A9P4P0B5_9PEZI|nr:hypothetical protein EJ08DRAFT_657257 [Tothia fuscella]
MSPGSNATTIQTLLFTQLVYQTTAAVPTARLWQAVSGAPNAASIVAVNSALTTYVPGCAEAFPAQFGGLTKDEICAPLVSMTVTQGPSTLAYISPVNMAVDATAAPTMVKEEVNCVLSASTAATCTVRYHGAKNIVAPAGMGKDGAAAFSSSLESYKIPQTTTLLGAEYPAFGPVAITAGAEKLSKNVKQVSTVADATGEAGASAAPDRTTVLTEVTATVETYASLETNPAGGGVNTSVLKSTSKSSAGYITPTGDAGASPTSSSTSAKPTATAKGEGAAVAVIRTSSLLVGLAAVWSMVFLSNGLTSQRFRFTAVVIPS